MSSQIERAKALLAWKQKKLNSKSEIDKAEIANFFAEKFEVIANDRHYDANYDNYLAFLNEFKQNIEKLTHDVYEYLQAGQTIIMPMRAMILHTSGKKKQYEAAMFLKFDGDDKIIQWREVCVALEG